MNVYRTIGPLVCSGRIRTLVAMATYSSHRLMMGKRGNRQFFLSHWGCLDFFLQKCLLSKPLLFGMTFVEIGEFDGLSGWQKGSIFAKNV